MERNNASLKTSSVPKIIVGILVVVALYYLYSFLTSNSGLEGNVILSSIKSADTSTPYSAVSSQVPAIYEGGEASFNTWIYINNYATRSGYNKHVLSFGGDNFTTCVVYLGPYKNKLSVRVQTKAPSSTTASDVNLTDSALYGPNGLFMRNITDSSLLDANTPCDITSVELQKWVQLSVILNNKTCDVYLDGKLTRSCILPSFYRVDNVNKKVLLCNKGGFGGFVSNVSVYNYALNPEQIWKLYMNGPGPQYSVWDYITSLFSPSSAMTLDYPKQNITV
jgi:hypothetical protein